MTSNHPGQRGFDTENGDTSTDARLHVPAAAPSAHVAQGEGGAPTCFHRCDAQTLLGDSAAVVDESVSLILTDPPYLISRETGFTKGGDRGFAISMDFGASDRDGGFSLDALDAIIGGFGRALRPGGAIVVFFDVWKIVSYQNKGDYVGCKQALDAVG